MMLIVILALQNMTKHYYVVAPGGAYSLSDKITVNEIRRIEAGEFYMTATIVPRLNWASLLVGALSPQMDVIPFNLPITKERLALVHLDMEGSKKEAIKTALKKTIGVNSGIRVLEVLSGSPLSERVEVGDVITKIEEINSPTTGHLASVLAGKRVGDKILVVVRDKEGREAKHEVNLVSHLDSPNKPALRIVTMTKQGIISLPDIQIDSQDIRGPSAGLMFALEIMDRLLTENLTGGYKIAGTGVLINSRVMPVEGVRQKAISAEKEGADFFIVPVDGYMAAKGAAKEMVVIPVRTLNDALDFLYGLSDVK